MKPNVGLNLRVTGHCNQGGRKYMEDAFVVGYQQSENLKELVYAYFGIFDGHGGREAALFAKENLMNNIVSQKGFWSDDDSRILKAIRDGFLATHYAMWKEVGSWPKTMSGLPSTSGTTSSIAFIRKQKLYTGHVGDSKIVLGCQHPDSREWYAQSLTEDHKPGSPDERKRIDSAGGLVLKKAGVQRVVWNRPHPGHKGPIRRSTPVEQIPFLAVSRSLGDLWSFNYKTNEFVVSPDPDVGVFELNPRVHRCILFGSDGLWNMITAQNAIRIVQKADEENEKLILEGGRANDTLEKLNNPSRLLVDTALRHWHNFRMRADNISVVTVMLDPPGPCKREVLLRQRVMKRLRPRDEQGMSEDEAVKSQPTKESPPPNIKDRKRTSECFESPKEKKLLEPACKERKLSTEICEPSIPKNLPKPVILSPVKVVRPKTKSTDPSDSMESTPGTSDSSDTENCDASVKTAKPSENPASSKELDENVKKKDHGPSSGEVVSASGSENKLLSEQTGSRFQSESSEKTVDTCKSDSCENTGEKRNISAGGGENERMSRTDKGDSSYQSNSNVKENGRIHLCEVDNIVKLNNRTSDCCETKTVRSKDQQKRDSIMSSNEKNFRKSTVLCRNDANRKKYTSTLRKPRSKTNISTCRTRARSNIKKFKV